MDTGSDLSLIKENSLIKDSSVNENKIKTLLGIGNKPVYTLGEINLEILINNKTILHKFHVVSDTFPVDANGVIGNDFLTLNNAIINYGSKKVVISNKLIDLICLKLYSGSRSMITIPPRTEMVVPVKIISKLKEGLIQNKTIIDGLFCPSALIKADKNNIGYTTILNTTEKEIIINNLKARLNPIEYYREPSNVFQINQVENASNCNSRFEDVLNSLRLDHLNNEEKDSISKIFRKYEYLFHLDDESLSATNVVSHEIHTKNDAPISSKIYRYPHHFKDIVNKEINNLLNQNIITPSISAWNSPVWIVPKKVDATGEKKYRLVIDYRKLNEQTIGDAYPIPNISDILDQLGQSKYFTTLDLASGYHQIKMHPRDAEKTAFSVPLGHYEFKRMPFGLKNAPSTFQRLMNTVLSGLQGTRCLVYLDDIVIFADNLQNHNKKLIEIFERLKEFNLKIRPSKCEFLRKEVIYLGHKISENGAQPDESKLDAVRKFPTPKTTKDIKSFLGLAGYYRKFIDNFSQKALPLTGLLKKDASFEWTAEQEKSFEILKNCLCEQPILQFPDFEKPFNVTTDASNFAIGAVLSQGDYPKDFPVAYASRCLNSAETNYSVIERELLAIVWTVRYFRPYLYGRRFRIVTDHQPLTWLFNIKDPKSRLVRWRLELEEHDYSIVYKPGRVNSNADALSRNPVVVSLTQAKFKSEETKDTYSHLDDKNVSSSPNTNGHGKSKLINSNPNGNEIKVKKDPKNNYFKDKLKPRIGIENKLSVKENNDTNKNNNGNVQSTSNKNEILNKRRKTSGKKEIKFKCYDDFMYSNSNVLKIYQNTNIEELNIPVKDFKNNLVLRLTMNFKGFNKNTKEIFYDNFHLNFMRPRILVHGPLKKGEVMHHDVFRR